MNWKCGLFHIPRHSHEQEANGEEGDGEARCLPLGSKISVTKKEGRALKRALMTR